MGVADSIRSSVSWLEQNPAPDLILMDIELADGQSFEVSNLNAFYCIMPEEFRLIGIII